MDSQQQLLVSLFLSLFQRGGLSRFARHTFGESVSLAVDQMTSPTEQAVTLVEQLSKRHLIDTRLFDTLEALRPQHKEQISRVRAECLNAERKVDPQIEVVRDGENIHGNPDNQEVLDERAAWRKRMEFILEEAPEYTPALSEKWLYAAAVLPHFQPALLRPLAGGTEDRDEDALVHLASVCDAQANGLWALKLRKRQNAIAQLWKDKRILEALDANPDEKSEHTRLLLQIASGNSIDVRELNDYSALLAAQDLSDWFRKTDFEPFDLDQLASRIERMETTTPLRKLTGTHFRGRAEELSTLRTHIEEDGELPRILVVQGIGGVGKSALLGKLLLEFESRVGTPQLWAYLDFDDPKVDPTHPRKLIELIARQLSLLFTSVAEKTDFQVLESAAAGDMSLSIDLDLDQGSELPRFIETLDASIRRLPIPPSLILVLDTFEQVQVRGKRTVAVIREFLDQLLGVMPYAKVIISGRATISEWQDVTNLELQDLDLTSANQVLDALGIKSNSLRAKVVEHIGTNPLSLRLAADAIQKKQIDETDLAGFVRDAQEIEVQGQLYTRILGHIQDSEVRQLAHPGLIIRRVTPEVIRVVLANVCQIDPSHAEQLFDRLPNYVSLFEPDQLAPGEHLALRHRQDVREKMLRLMMADPTWWSRIDEIHRTAIAYYEGKGGSIARAEELYHRLMRDDDPEKLDPLWSQDLINSLSRCWDEPLPPRARVWLGPRIGQIHGDVEAWRTADWEISAEREVEAHLRTGDPEGALNFLRSRNERTPGSRLYRWEIEALIRLGRDAEAQAVLQTALPLVVAARNYQEALKLHLLGAEVALRQQNEESLRKHATRAKELALQVGDHVAHLRALELNVTADHKFHAGVDARKHQRELEGAFTALEAAELIKDPATSKRILQALGTISTPILKKAAITFGNRDDQDLLQTDAFKLEKLLDQVKDTDGGKSELSKLAGEVGLNAEGFSMVDLAASAIRYGRLGDAVAKVIDLAGKNRDILRTAFSMFKSAEMSNWERYLSDEELRQVQGAATNAGLARDSMLDALIQGIHPNFAATLPSAGLTPAAKLSTHLRTMNRVPNLRNGDVPLAQWLRAAIDLSGDQPAAIPLEKALLKVTSTSPGRPANAMSLDAPAAAAANFEVRPEAMIGGFDSTLPIKYLQQALAATASVFKLLVHRHINGEPEFVAGDVKHLVNGTGWLIGPGLLITNHHVINARMKFPVAEPNASAEDFELQAANTTILYDYFETDKPSTTVTTGAGALLASDETLDFAILRVPATAPQRSPLRLRRQHIRKTLQQSLGTRVNILQHPNGDPMRLGFRENYVVFGDDKSLTYLTDTAVGSSGSPVTDDAWSVAALHAGSQEISDKNIVILGTKIRLENFGIPIPAIMSKLQADHPDLHAEILAGQV